MYIMKNFLKKKIKYLVFTDMFTKIRSRVIFHLKQIGLSLFAFVVLFTLCCAIEHAFENPDSIHFEDLHFSYFFLNTFVDTTTNKKRFISYPFLNKFIDNKFNKNKFNSHHLNKKMTYGYPENIQLFNRPSIHKNAYYAARVRMLDALNISNYKFKSMWLKHPSPFANRGLEPLTNFSSFTNRYYILRKQLKCTYKPRLRPVGLSEKYPLKLDFRKPIDMFKFPDYVARINAENLANKKSNYANIVYFYNYLSFNNINYKNTVYNPHFPNLNSDVLVYLTMWQYWWWFWFIFLCTFYYVFLVKTLFIRQKKFNPRINTSVKSHGRWGDLIVGLIPIYWCLNILINSNFLLKTLEWQTETNILTFRIRGKQWYWVYKIDVFQIDNLYKLGKNVGRNNIQSDNYKFTLEHLSNLFLSKLWNFYYNKEYKNDLINGNYNKVSLAQRQRISIMDYNNPSKDDFHYISNTLFLKNYLTNYILLSYLDKDYHVDYNASAKETRSALNYYADSIFDYQFDFITRHFFYYIVNHHYFAYLSNTINSATRNAHVLRDHNFLDFSKIIIRRRYDFNVFYNNITFHGTIYPSFSNKLIRKLFVYDFDRVIHLIPLMKIINDDCVFKTLMIVQPETTGRVINPYFYEFREKWTRSLDTHYYNTLFKGLHFYRRRFNRYLYQHFYDYELSDLKSFPYLINIYSKFFYKDFKKVFIYNKIAKTPQVINNFYKIIIGYLNRGKKIIKITPYMRYEWNSLVYWHHDFYNYYISKQIKQLKTPKITVFQYNKAFLFSLKNTSWLLIRSLWTESDLLTEFYRNYIIFSRARNKTFFYNFFFIKSNYKLGLKYKSNMYKPYPNNMYFIIKQTRVPNLTKIKKKTDSAVGDTMFYKYENIPTAFSNYSKDNQVFLDNSSRLLTTNFTLVLPANINLTAITNSYDVIHSWFIPGLGIKMDCVPGRSTHHTFYFDVYGLFLGQCAEICGRFHHHMPIKVALVHYDIFLLWVNNFLFYFIFDKNAKKKINNIF